MCLLRLADFFPASSVPRKLPAPSSFTHFQPLELLSYAVKPFGFMNFKATSRLPEDTRWDLHPWRITRRLSPRNIYHLRLLPRTGWKTITADIEVLGYLNVFCTRDSSQWLSSMHERVCEFHSSIPIVGSLVMRNSVHVLDDPDKLFENSF